MSFVLWAHNTHDNNLMMELQWPSLLLQLKWLHVLMPLQCTHAKVLFCKHQAVHLFDKFCGVHQIVSRSKERFKQFCFSGRLVQVVCFVTGSLVFLEINATQCYVNWILFCLELNWLKVMTNQVNTLPCSLIILGGLLVYYYTFVSPFFDMQCMLYLTQGFLS